MSCASMAMPVGMLQPGLGLRLVRDLPDEAADSRLEGWITHHLTGTSATASAAAAGPWGELIEGLPSLRPRREAKAATAGVGKTPWGRFRLSMRQGVAVVRLTDRSLTRDVRIQEFADDLHAVIAAGLTRVVLDFTEVERLSSWVVGVVARSARLCRAAEGGALKLCGLTAPNAEVFTMTRLNDRAAIHPDLPSALASDWPLAPPRGSLPLAILTELSLPSGQAFAESPTMSLPPPSEIEVDVAADPTVLSETGRPDAPNPLWLHLHSAGRTWPLALQDVELVIGRDPSCQVRLTTVEASRRHAAIFARDGAVWVRDLGSTNGTILNGRKLSGEAARLHQDDEIRIGSLMIRLTIGELGSREAVEELVSAWLLPDGPPTADESATVEHDQDHALELLRSERIDDVLVLTPRRSDLATADAVDALRTELREMAESHPVRHVVLNLDCVGNLEGAALGVIVSHSLRVRRMGGTLRLAQPQPRVMLYLAQMHVPELIECCPTLDEAILQPWSAGTGTGA